MDNLINEMTGESFEHIGRLVVAKLNEKSPDERRVVVQKIFDAIYAPITPNDERLDRLVGFVRDMYDGLSEEAKKAMTLQIQTVCMQAQTKCENSNNNTENFGYLANQPPVEAVPYVTTPRWLNKDKKIGKKVRVLVGLQYGMIAQVDGFDHDMVLVKSADGKITKYLKKHVEYLD